MLSVLIGCGYGQMPNFQAFGRTAGEPSEVQIPVKQIWPQRPFLDTPVLPRLLFLPLFFQIFLHILIINPYIDFLY